jgi:hypothetical protein
VTLLQRDSFGTGFFNIVGKSVNITEIADRMSSHRTVNDITDY